jgi:hypothetical protein
LPIRLLKKALAAFCIAAGLAAAVPLPCALAAAPSPDSTLSRDSERAWREVSAARDLQTELPLDRKDAMREENRPHEKTRADASSWNLNRNFFRILLWGSILIILVIIVLNLKDNLWSASRSRRLTPGEEEYAAPAAIGERMDKAQCAADELARQGSYAEAMHALLLQSVAELRLRLDVTFAVSMTSREILRKVGLAAAGREAFSDIILRVEISWFGSHLPGPEDYQACRRSFEILTRALRQGAGSGQRGGE